MNRIESAVSRFAAGQNCSQAVLGAFAADFGLDSIAASKLASGFGGGMRLGHTCGAVTGALMVLGLAFGADDPADPAAKQRITAVVRDFAARFKARHSSTMCKDLLGYDPSDPAQYAAAQEKGLFKTLCPAFVRSAAELVEETLKAHS